MSYAPPPDPAVVAFGGGHGLSATLGALRLVTSRISAVVSVADDGGSSGRLRQEFDVLPPGDLRMALAALSDSGHRGQTWRDVFQHRFSSEGPLNKHAVGNLVITALTERTGDPVTALDLAGELLHAKGRVLPQSTIPLQLQAEVVDGEGNREVLSGQSRLASTTSHIERLWVTPSDAPACAEAVDAVEQADWLIFGPGSWFTSVIPHLLLPDMAAALRAAPGRKCLTTNLIAQDGETAAMDTAALLEAFHDHAPDLKIDVVIADPITVRDGEELENQAKLMGAKLLLRRVARGRNPGMHDTVRLAAAYRDVFEGAYLNFKVAK